MASILFLRFVRLRAISVLVIGLVSLTVRAMAYEVPFADQVITTDAVGAQSVYAVDLDCDGDFDVLSASAGDDTVAWYENDGSSLPTWTMRTITASADGAADVTASDLDGDGDIDVVAAAALAWTVLWFENDGAADPTFVEHMISDTAESVFSVSTADVDGDGDTDVLSASLFSDIIAWHENDGGSPPLFTERVIATSYEAPGSVATADLDGDGDIDALSAAQISNAIVWHENDGATPPGFIDRLISSNALYATSVASADVDGDGDIDLLSSSLDDNKIAWYENEGGSPPTFTERIITTSALSASEVLASDLDFDGDTDVFSTSYADNTVRWYENDGQSPPGFTTRIISDTAEGAADVFVADVNGDGDADVLSASNVDNTIAWYDNVTIHRNALYPMEQIVDTGVDEADESRAYDIDGDGDLDVLAVGRAANLVAWWENVGGSGATWTEHTIDSANNRAAGADAADIDGDGDLDVISVAFLGDDVFWHKNTAGDGTAWTRITVDANYDGAQACIGADLDGDGDVDIVANAETADDVTWYVNVNGDGSAWTKITIDGSFDGANYVDAADMDKDGDLDVVSAARNGDQLAWWANDGTGTSWTKHVVANGFDLAASAHDYDMDGDGDLDILGAAFNANDVTWFENLDGQGTSWSAHLVNGDFTFAIYAFAADLDFDGDLDIVGTAHNLGEIAWFENLDGDALTWVEHNVTLGFDIATFAVAADLNGDGALDILGAAAVDDAIKWWANEGGQFSLTTVATAPVGMTENQTDDVLKIDVTHLGRDGDTDIELAALSLLFEQTPGDPLTTGEAENILNRVSVYLDDGSGIFDAEDVLVTTTETLSLDSGVQLLTLPDDNADLRITFGEPRAYFVVVKLTNAAADQGLDTFRVTHLTASSVVEDADFDIPLKPSFASSVVTGLITILNGTAGDSNGNGIVDLDDYATFQSCFTSPNGGPLSDDCLFADLDGDGDVDLADFGLFQAAFTGI